MDNRQRAPRDAEKVGRDDGACSRVRVHCDCELFNGETLQGGKEALFLVCQDMKVLVLRLEVTGRALDMGTNSPIR